MFNKNLLKKRWFTSLIALVLLGAIVVGVFGYNILTQKTQKAHADTIGPISGRCIIFNGQKSPGCGPESKLAGYIDALNDTSVTGWACDQAYAGQKVRIDVYAGGTAGSPNAVFIGGGVMTGGSRADAAGQCNGDPNVGYTAQLQCNSQKAGVQEIHVYAINDAADNSNKADAVHELPYSNTQTPRTAQIRAC